jgi:thiosulfate/3-mercaptopyruvate sulfurtransferase
LNSRSLQIGFATVLLAVFAACGVTIQAQQAPAKSSVLVDDETIPSAALLQPAELVQMLRSSEKPLVLQVGSHVFFAEAHIPDSEYIGATGTSAGLQVLRERVSDLKKDQVIVIYCGCCPWGRCPNIRPAYKQLQALGFTHVRALYLADNFGTNWVDKGYPVAKGR